MEVTWINDEIWGFSSRYIDTVFTMIEYAPEAVGEPVWHRAVQVS